MCCAGFDLLEGEAHALELLYLSEGKSTACLRKYNKYSGQIKDLFSLILQHCFCKSLRFLFFVVVFQKVPALEIDSAPVLEYLNH